MWESYKYWFHKLISIKFMLNMEQRILNFQLFCSLYTINLIASFFYFYDECIMYEDISIFLADDGLKNSVKYTKFFLHL